MKGEGSMNDINKLKYDLALHCASIMVQRDISSSELPIGIYDIRNKMISRTTDFAEIMTDRTMNEDSLLRLLKLFS